MIMITLHKFNPFGDCSLLNNPNYIQFIIFNLNLMQAQNQEKFIERNPEQIYSSADNNQKLSYFLNSNRIISSPHVVLQFFKSFHLYSVEKQEKVLNELLNALRSVTTNAYLLNQQQRLKRKNNFKELLEGNEDQRDIITIIVDLLLGNVKNYLIFNLLLVVLEELLPYSTLDDSLLRAAISKLIVHFYDKKVYASQLFATASVFKSFYHAKITAQKDPNNMLAFHGTNKLQIFPQKRQQLPWILKEGFTLLFWINIQNIKSGVQASLPKLFTFYAPEVGGIEAYLIDNKIYYRILGAKYTEPQIGSNGLLIGQLQPKKWNFVCFQHQSHHTFQKSKLKCYINKGKPNIVGLDPPKISSSAQTKYIFFDKIYCRTSSVCLFPSLLGNQAIEDYNKHINSCENIKNPKALVFEARQGRVFERTGFGVSHNFIFERSLQMNFQLVIPLFYLLRYQQKDQMYPTLNELLSTFVLFLRKSSHNQTQSVKNGYFKTISQLICDVKKNVFDENTIKSILYIKHTITDLALLDQYFSDFLWPFISANIQIIRKQQILQIIKNAFTQNIAHYSNQIGLDQMINALQNLQRSTLTCCEKHFKIASNKFQRSLEGINHFGQDKKAQKYIFSLIENTFQNSKIHYAHEIYKLCRLLCLKFSPCFVLELMSLIKRLLTQKFNEKLSESQIKQIAKYFQQKNVYQIFLHVIQNNFFAQIKAESVKLIYTLLIKKSSIEESYISHLISKSLWKINEFAEQKEQVQEAKPQERKQSEHQEQIKKSPLLQQIESEEKQFSLVGPQAPALSNRLKGKKSFDFGFVNQVKGKPMRQIMEEEKTTEPQALNLPSFAFNDLQKKKDKKKFLCINTEAINQMYTFGGQKGQQIIISEDQQQNELQKIVKLAKKCVAAMNGKKQAIQQPYQEERKKATYIPPPMTTKNKAVVAKKTFNLNLISEEQQEVPVKIPTPLATKKSNKTPTSIKSSNQQNLFTLYNSLLQCCLDVSFQTSLISSSKIQVPSILNIFFKWIPQTDLETKFLNDLEIILESNQNMALVAQLPELYDFLFELSYKCLLFEQMKEKRVYAEKLENIIKLVFAYVYQEDLTGFSKFAFILNWTQSKKSENYEPKCLFLTSRYTILLMLECIQELLIMNNKNDQVMERNFQSISIVLQTLKKIVPEDLEEISVDQCERVVFVQDLQLPTSLIPYFKSNWVDFILYQKYLFLFKRFYCTEWYKSGLKNFETQQVQLNDFLRKTNTAFLQKESAYYLKSNFLVSLIQIQRAMLIEMKTTQPRQVNQYGTEAIWQTILLVILAEFPKDKFIKSQKSQFILTFLKSCKILSQKGIQRIVQIVPMLCIVKHSLPVMSAPQQAQKPSVSTQIIDDIISNYIPQYLLNMGKTDLQSFNLNFNEVWIPNQNHYKKIHSELFVAYRDKIKKDQEINFIQFVSNILEEQNQRREYTNVLVEAFTRTIKNSFRKLWYSLRIYNQLWTHPQFKWQQDRLFTKTIYAYERYEASPFFRYKVAKQFSRGKGRFFLKPKLIDPEFCKQTTEKSYNSANQYNLEKALKDLNEKIILGVSKRTWISSRGQESLYFMSDFKKVRIINTLTCRTGYLSLINDSLIFISSVQIQKQSHLTIDQYKLRSDKTMHKLWPLEYIREIYKRRYVNKKKSVQINFIYNKSVIFDFENEEQAQQFCKKILKLKNKCINLSFVGKSLDPKKLIESQQYSKKWMSYDLTTFDYLMELNTLAGRAYSDLTQYPVFPWVLKNFNDQKCLLNDENSMRKLALPMGANGTQERINNFEQRYEAMHMDDQFATKFHYGTHYSSPGIIYHFLVRLSPYTEGSILLQSGRFDFADRLFFSLADSYKNATAQYSDVRELLPQMYSIPQTYLNINGLDLGVMQSKKRVNNVELPEWCNENPYIFIYYMRKSLEEKYCNSQIHNWIDLIFGYKQKGEEAVKALNCFYYLTYQDAVPWDHIKNEKDIQSIESQVVNFGQTPGQIFAKPHPQRNHSLNSRNFRAICDAQAEPKVYRPSKSNMQKTGDTELNPMNQADQSIIFMKWISESKVVFIRRSGQLIFYKCFPNANPATKIPFQCTIQKEKRVDRIKKNVFDPNQFYDPSLDVLNFPIELIGNGHSVCLGGLSDGKLVLIDVDTGSIAYSYPNHGQTISCIKSDPRQNFLITGDITGKVIMWEIKTNNNNISKLIQKKVIKDQQGQITSIYFSNQLQCVAIASVDGSVFVYNMITGKKLRVYYHEKRSRIDEVVITSNPVAAVVLFCNSQNTIYSYSLNGQLIARSHQKNFEYFLSPAVMKDSKSFQLLAYGNQRSEIIFRQLPFLTIPLKNNFKVAKDASVNKISVSKYSRFLFSGCSDGELTVITDPVLVNNS